VLVGTSRKAFLGAVLTSASGERSPVGVEARDDATLATAVWVLERGARVVRVHAVQPVAETIRLLTVIAGLDDRAVA
jgi:dihydropteroate synthase